jgi:hypothetical protein
MTYEKLEAILSKKTSDLIWSTTQLTVLKDGIKKEIERCEVWLSDPDTLDLDTSAYHFYLGQQTVLRRLEKLINTDHDNTNEIP